VGVACTAVWLFEVASGRSSCLSANGVVCGPAVSVHAHVNVWWCSDVQPPSLFLENTQMLYANAIYTVYNFVCPWRLTEQIRSAHTHACVHAQRRPPLRWTSACIIRWYARLFASSPAPPPGGHLSMSTFISNTPTKCDHP